MKRMKTFFIYALLVVAVVISTDFLINLCLDTNYREIVNCKIEATSPAIEIKEAKTTNANGYVKGVITNNLENDIEKAYIKLDLYSKQGNDIGTEYLEIDNLKQNESKEFRIDYRKYNVDSIKINTANEIVSKNIKLMPFLQDAEKYFAIGILISIVPFYFF